MHYLMGSGKPKEIICLEKEIQEAKTELKVLEKAHEDSFLNYCEYVQEEKKVRLSNTLQGKLLQESAKFLSVYCLYKIFMSLLNLVMGRKKGIDPISRVLRVFLVISEDTYEVFSTYISFVFMGYLMISNVRSFTLNLVNLSQVFMRSCLSRLVSTDIVIYLISQALGTYFLTTLVLLQTSLPSQYLGNFTILLGNIDIIHHFRIFDAVFLISSITSFLLIYLNLQIKNRKYSIYLDKAK